MRLLNRLIVSCELGLWGVWLIVGLSVALGTELGSPDGGEEIKEENMADICGSWLRKVLRESFWRWALLGCMGGSGEERGSCSTRLSEKGQMLSDISGPKPERNPNTDRGSIRIPIILHEYWISLLGVGPEVNYHFN